MPESASTSTIGARAKARPVHSDLTKPGSNGPDRDRVLALVGMLNQAEDEKSAAGKKVSGIKKSIEAENISLEALAQVRRALAEASSSAVMARFKQFKLLAGWLGLPIANQLDLFEQPRTTNGVAKDGILDQAEEEGRLLGLLAKAPDHQKYPLESDTGQAHLKGWNAGQDTKKEQFMQINRENAERERERKQAVADKAKKKAMKAAAPPKLRVVKPDKAAKEAERTARKKAIPKRAKKK